MEAVGVCLADLLSQMKRQLKGLLEKSVKKLGLKLRLINW